MRTYLVALFCFFTLSACTAVSKSQKIDMNARPVGDMQILVQMGHLPTDGVVSQSQHSFYENQLKAAMHERIPQIFRANGISVKSITVGNSDPINPMAMQHTLDAANTSHILVLNIKSFAYATRYQVKQFLSYVNFDADLWDVQDKRMVWKAQPYLQIQYQHQPLLQTQHLAGQLLNGMNTDGLIALKQPHAIDLAGDRISDVFHGTKDR